MRLTFVGALTSVWVGLLPPVADMAEIQPSRTSVPESYPLAPPALIPLAPPSLHPFCPLSHPSSQSPTAVPRPALVATIQLFAPSPPSSSACPPSPPSHLSEWPPRRSSAGPPHAPPCGARRPPPLSSSCQPPWRGRRDALRCASRGGECGDARERADRGSERVCSDACMIDGVCRRKRSVHPRGRRARTWSIPNTSRTTRQARTAT